MRLTVEEFLSREQEKGMRCIAGFEGLDHVITGFTIMDVPDVAKWLKGGELVVSAGYFTAEKAGNYEVLIKELVEHHCAAFGVKMHYYHENIPEKFVELANRYHLPLIELNYALRFSDIAYCVHRNMFYDEIQIDQKMQYFCSKIEHAIFTGSESDSVLYYMNLLLGHPVFLLDTEYRCLGMELGEVGQNAYLKSLSDKKGELILRKQQCIQLSGLFHETHFSSHLFALDGNPGEQFVLAPVVYDQSLQGFLLAHEGEQAFTQEHYQIIEKLTELLGIYFLKSRMLGVSMTGGANGFLQAVLLAPAQSEETIRHYANLYGFPLDKRRICINFGLEEYNECSYAKKQSIRSAVESRMDYIARQSKRQVYKVIFDGNFALFFFYGEKDEKTDIWFEAEQTTKYMMQEIGKYGWKVKTGISNLTSAISQIPQSFKQAIELILLGKQIGLTEDVFRFVDLEIDYSLWSGHTTEELKVLAAPVWKLYQYDKENRFEGILTLEAYIANKYNVTQTAKALHLHRNSLMYRMERIEEVLENDLENQNELFHLQLGLHALRLIRNL